MQVLKAFLILILFSCSDNHFNPENSRRTAWQYNQPKRYFEKKPDHYFYTYDTSLTEMENFDIGYIDTFFVNGIKFQLLSNPDSTADLELQVSKNGKYQTNLKLPYGINGYTSNRDLNRDGINDFILSQRRGSEVYLFDTFANEFHREYIALAFDWSIIDSTKNIYSNNYSNGDFWSTDLFSLQGFRQTFLYEAVINVNIDSVSEKGYLQLFRIKKNHLENALLICTRNIDLLNGDFEYCKFWKMFLRKKRCC